MEAFVDRHRWGQAMEMRTGVRAGTRPKIGVRWPQWGRCFWGLCRGAQEVYSMFWGCFVETVNETRDKFIPPCGGVQIQQRAKNDLNCKSIFIAKQSVMSQYKS